MLSKWTRCGLHTAELFTHAGPAHAARQHSSPVYQPSQLRPPSAVSPRSFLDPHRRLDWTCIHPRRLIVIAGRAQHAGTIDPCVPFWNNATRSILYSLLLYLPSYSPPSPPPASPSSLPSALTVSSDTHVLLSRQAATSSSFSPRPLNSFLRLCTRTVYM